MVAPIKLNLKIYQGSTFKQVLRWESSTKKYTPITAIEKSAPMVVTAPGHGAVVGWRAKLSNVGGMKEVNALDYNIITDVTTDTVTFNQVNSLGFTTYTTGGVLEYNEPVPLAGYTARMQIREKLDSATILEELTTENGGIIIDDIVNTITIYLSAESTALYTTMQAVYSLELVTSTLEVVPFAGGNVTLYKEVTR